MTAGTARQPEFPTAANLPECATRILEPGGGVTTQDHGMTLEQLTEAYHWMTLSKVVDERAFNLQRQGRLGTFSPTRGQEASVVGSAQALRVGVDWIVPQYRELGACLMHGLPLPTWFTYWMGNMTGGRIPDDVRILPVQISLAAQIPHAVGLAWARKLLGTDEVAISYFGDGASSEGDFHEALNFAGVLKAPVVFFLQNNGWAISTPRSAQSAAHSFAARAHGYGIESETVDGNDVIAVYEATRRAVDRARAGDGATLIESITYRLGPHNTADDHTRYVRPDEFEQMISLDPITRLRDHLLARGAWDDQREAELRASHERLTAQAVTAAESVPSRHTHVTDHVYASAHERLRCQALALAAEYGSSGR